MNEKDDSKISKLLKASPPLTPPESFYKGVLEKIKAKGQRDQGTERSTLFPFVPSSLRLSVRVLATACVLMVIVLATRETKKTEPQLFQQIAKSLNERTKTATGQNFPALKKSMQLSHAEPRREIGYRMDRDISHMVGNPSPFEDVDKEDAKALTAPQAWTTQARDTVNGVASQGSFMQHAKPALQHRAFGGIRAKDIPSPIAPHEEQAAADFVAAGPSAAVGVNSQLAGAGGAQMAVKPSLRGFEIAGPAVGREILAKTLPVYPTWAQEAGIEGAVRLFIRINSDGTVNPQVRITRTTGDPKLDQVAVEAVKKWKFSPSSAESWSIITFQFPPKN